MIAQYSDDKKIESYSPKNGSLSRINLYITIESQTIGLLEGSYIQLVTLKPFPTMFTDSKSKFPTTRSVQLATTRNYMEKRRLGQTILQYQKECKEIMKQLRDKQYSFLKAKYPHIVAMNNLQMMRKDELNSGTKGFDEITAGRERRLVSRPLTYVEKELNTSGNNRKRAEKRLPNGTERIYRRQKSTISLPSLTKRDIEQNRDLQIKYVTTRLPPLDELHL